MAISRAMQKEIDQAAKKITGLLKQLDTKERRRILRAAAKPLVKAAKNNVPHSDEPHYRYNTPKVSGQLKAPPGKGNIVAQYMPGNLARSIRTLIFRKVKDAVYVGPKVAKGNSSTGTFQGGRVDGYYAHWMEFGTVKFTGTSFMRRAVASTKTTVENLVKQGVKKSIKEYKRKNNIK